MSVAHFSEGAVAFSSLPPLFDSQKKILSQMRKLLESDIKSLVTLVF